jgi:hypothetical protein
VNALKGLAWRVDSVLGSSQEITSNKEVHVKFTVDMAPHLEGGAAEDTAFSLTADKFQVSDYYF